MMEDLRLDAYNVQSHQHSVCSCPVNTADTETQQLRAVELGGHRLANHSSPLHTQWRDKNFVTGRGIQFTLALLLFSHTDMP